MQFLLFMHHIITYNNNKFKYVYTNLFVILLFSFIYWYYGTPENFKSNTHFDATENMSYLNALYFSATTHSSVSYGDITPKSKFMQIIVIAHIILLVVTISILIL
jgi:hypothetical protein